MTDNLNLPQIVMIDKPGNSAVPIDKPERTLAPLMQVSQVTEKRRSSIFNKIGF